MIDGNHVIQGAGYPEAYVDFRWDLPERYNIGVEACDRWAQRDPDRTAIIEWREGDLRRYSFGDLARWSNRLANRLVQSGLNAGDRVAVLSPQRFETAAGHIAIFKAGAISVPLFGLFGSDALSHRLRDSGARFILAGDAGLAKMEPLMAALPALDCAIGIDDRHREDLERASAEFAPVVSSPNDPALIIYTSGTTGASKGALHGHRVLAGHLPGVEMSHGGLGLPGDCIWTPADWAWIGGLLDVLLPALSRGVPVVAHRFEKFDAVAAVRLMEDCQVTCTFMPPTALRMLRQAPDALVGRELKLRSIASGGESLGAEMLEWSRRSFGFPVNEFYGQTECNMIVSSCSAWFDSAPGAMGKPVPGHDVAIIGPGGDPVPVDTEGDIAVAAPDPVMFLGYWNNPTATRDKFVGSWLITGDRGRLDREGFVHFIGRADDVITSGGYRIGPSEIEDCLLKHPAVAAAAVVGVPDELRTEIVTAFVVLARGATGEQALVRELQQLVRAALGGHQYPRAIHFIAELPTTVTGKIVRRELRQRGIELAANQPG